MYPYLYNPSEGINPNYPNNHYSNNYEQYYAPENQTNVYQIPKNHPYFPKREDFISGRLSYMPISNIENVIKTASREHQYPIPVGIVFMMPVQKRAYLITVPETEKLKGRRIRTTLPNITGTVTATVGDYNAQTNRLMLLNIISDRNGVNYGNLAYLLDEIAGLQEVGTGTEPTAPDSTQDCTKTGGPGKRIDSGGVNVEGIPVRYTINECEVVVNVVGIRYVLTRGRNSVGVNYPINPLNRYQGRIYIENKTLWVELELQTKNVLTGKWHKTVGGKTKIGSWANLKI